MATMQEFLTSGRLGDIMLGIATNRAQQILGPPEDRSVRRTPVEILRYGALELTFRREPTAADSNLVAMALYFWDAGRSLPAPVLPTDWIPQHNTLEQELVNFLAEIESTPQSVVTRDNDRYFALPSGVKVVFGDGELHSFHFSRAVAEKRKQISVALPLETVKVLRQRARQQKISVQEVIEMLVVDKISTSNPGNSMETK